MKFIYTIFFSIITVIGKGQDENKLERNSFKLSLIVDENSTYDIDVPTSSYFKVPNLLQIYPSEKILIEIEQVNGVIKGLKVVKNNTHPDKTIQIFFSQQEKNHKHENMLLQIKNPFKMDLSYSAKIYLLNQKKWVETSVLPIKANLMSFETWPDIIVTMTLSDWKFIK